MKGRRGKQGWGAWGPGPCVCPICPPPSSPHGDDLEQPPGMRQPSLVHAEEARRAVGARCPHVQLGVDQRPGQGRGQACSSRPPTPPSRGHLYLRKPISSQLSPATLALEREEHSSRHVPSLSSNTVSRVSAGLTCTAGRQDGPPGSPSHLSPSWPALQGLVLSPGRTNQSTPAPTFVIVSGRAHDSSGSI